MSLCRWAGAGGWGRLPALAGCRPRPPSPTLGFARAGDPRRPSGTTARGWMDAAGQRAPKGRGELREQPPRVRTITIGFQPPPNPHINRAGAAPLCRTSKFHPLFCTHTAHDGPPVGSDSLGGVISAIVRGGIGAPALRPVSTEHLRDRVAVAGLPGRRAPKAAQAGALPRAASHLRSGSNMAQYPPLVSPCGIASEQTGDPGRGVEPQGEEPVLPSTSRNGARQEPEDNADQAGRSQGRAARSGRPGS
ncbi:hypothetical protein SAMN05216533_5206 [Streptomyces sp. Ag109_O5-10]|nr:hypothetical protein SAMN05216533_5206 [Streptomyces sp. Ag109_O5-10]